MYWLCTCHCPASQGKWIRVCCVASRYHLSRRISGRPSTVSVVSYLCAVLRHCTGIPSHKHNLTLLPKTCLRLYIFASGHLTSITYFRSSTKPRLSVLIVNRRANPSPPPTKQLNACRSKGAPKHITLFDALHDQTEFFKAIVTQAGSLGRFACCRHYHSLY